MAGAQAGAAAAGRGVGALAESATIGALFGTPVAAALLISEALAARQTRGALWDNVFAPLAAAAAGAMTTTLVAHPTFDLHLPALGRPGWGDVLAALVLAPLAAALGMAAVYLFPYVHGAFSRLKHPMLTLPVGGLVLGLLAALGGHLTLFKGLDEVGELAADPEGWSAGQFATMTIVKLAALLVAASCGFRGGRIFPSVFIGVAFGLFAHAVVPAVHPALGVAIGVLGMLLAITRQGWVSLFTAAILVASPRDPRPAVHRLAACLAAGDRETADAVARGRNSGSLVPVGSIDPYRRQAHAVAPRSRPVRRAPHVREPLLRRGQSGRRHVRGPAQAPAPRRPAAPDDGGPARAGRADAGRQLPPEPGDFRHHLDGAGSRAS